MSEKYFIITIDTEGDNLWGIRNSDWSISKITNRNGEYLERFQELCEKFGFIPTYLVDYEMSLSKPFISMAEKHKENLEIGMHMHAWNTPPYYALSNCYGGNKPYIGEYPLDIQKKKVEFITKQLEDVFQTKIISHRGGRWYIDSQYLKILKAYGYMIDCTVTPGIDWTKNNGQTEGSHGIDFSKAFATKYEISERDVCKKGNGGMIEVPVSLLKKKRNISYRLKHMDLWNRGNGNSEYMWLRPNGNNLNSMKSIIEEKNKKAEYLEFMIHSSELMPKGSPTFKTKASIEKLYSAIEELFSVIKSYHYDGIKLSDYGSLR